MPGLPQNDIGRIVMPRLSIIIAAYNAEEYIDRCIGSVLPLGEECEVIVVDDASSDSTGKLLQKYESIKVIHLEKNMGCVAKTRNIGLDNATGEYITFLDADDMYETGAVKKLLAYLDKFEPDILKFGYTLFYPNGEKREPQSNIILDKFVEKACFGELVYPRFIDGIGLNSVCLAVFKRSMGMRFSDKFQTAEDAAFSLDAYTAANSVLFVSERLYCYYQSGGGLTGSGISVLQKYKYNFMLSKKILKLLPRWGMDKLNWKIRAVLRPIRLTIDKIKRG